MRDNVSENCMYIYMYSQMFEDNWNANDKFFQEKFYFPLKIRWIMARVLILSYIKLKRFVLYCYFSFQISKM